MRWNTNIIFTLEYEGGYATHNLIILPHAIQWGLNCEIGESSLQ